MRTYSTLLAVVALCSLAGCAASSKSTTSSGSGGQQTIHTSAKAVTTGEHTLPSGLKYEDLTVGSGPVAEPGSTVSVHYTGWLTDKTKFDSSLDSGRPLTFVIGSGQVIPGWEEGITGMRVGGRRRLVIPPNLAYGDRGASGVIPPNATLLFEVELLSVQ